MSETTASVTTARGCERTVADLPAHLVISSQVTTPRRLAAVTAVVATDAAAAYALVEALAMAQLRALLQRSPIAACAAR